MHQSFETGRSNALLVDMCRKFRCRTDGVMHDGVVQRLRLGVEDECGSKFKCAGSL
eukprot:jgi/Botrbrau1/23365/Bobra.0051s0018.1